MYWCTCTVQRRNNFCINKNYLISTYQDAKKKKKKELDRTTWILVQNCPIFKFLFFLFFLFFKRWTDIWCCVTCMSYPLTVPEYLLTPYFVDLAQMECHIHLCQWFSHGKDTVDLQEIFMLQTNSCKISIWHWSCIPDNATHNANESQLLMTCVHVSSAELAYR